LTTVLVGGVAAQPAGAAAGRVTFLYRDEDHGVTG
jgi:hypothetical protein